MAGVEALVDCLLPKKKHSAAAQNSSVEMLRQRVQPQQHRGHIALLSYSDQTVKDVICAMKYEKHKMSIVRAASLLLDCIIDELREQETLHTMRYMLCTIPITQERKTENGFNHLHALVTEMHSRMAAIHPPLQDGRHLLRWTRKVSRQSNLKNRAERLNNVP